MDLKSITKREGIASAGTGRAKDVSGVSLQKELKNAGLLEDAFSSFSSAAAALQKHYGLLEKRVGALNGELAEKSVALEESLEKTSQAERYQTSILRSLPSAVMVTDVNGVITTFNRKAEEITGLTQCVVRGEKLEDVLGEKYFSEVLHPKSFEGETDYVNQNGEGFHLRVSTSLLTDSVGKVEGRVIILHDITKEKMLEENLERGKRLAAMGEVAARLAHEIRNPLGGIELFASNLKKHLPEDTRSHKMAENICGGIASLNYIVTNILQFSKTKMPLVKGVPLAASIDEALALAAHLVERSGVEVEKNYRTSEVEVLGDKEMLRQAFLNIILNSVQAMEGGGRLEISLFVEGGRDVKAVFCDSGGGIPQPVMDKIYDPFYTTKESGTGLGLAIVKSIIDGHGGKVEIESEEGRGTTVSVSLPVPVRNSRENEL